LTSHSDDKMYELTLNQDEFDVTSMAVEIALEDAKRLAKDVSDFVPVKKGLVENAEDFLAMQSVAADNVVHLESTYQKLIAEGGEPDDGATVAG
jgi:hypothetical protein